MKCKECGCPILMHMKFYKHVDGTILCGDCFKKCVPSRPLDKKELLGYTIIGILAIIFGVSGALALNYWL